MQLWFVSYIDRMEIEITETRSMNAVSSQQIYSLRTDTEPVMWLSNSIPNIPCNIENFMTYYRKTWYLHVGGKRCQVILNGSHNHLIWQVLPN